MKTIARAIRPLEESGEMQRSFGAKSAPQDDNALGGYAALENLL